MNKAVAIQNKEEAYILLAEKVMSFQELDNFFKTKLLGFIKIEASFNYIRIWIDEYIDNIKILNNMSKNYYKIEAYKEIEDLVLYIIDEIDE